MIFILLIFIIIFVSILTSILVFKNEDKKDKALIKRKQGKIYNEFLEVYSNIKPKEEYKEYLNSDHWKQIRLKALDRAGNRCQLCSSTNNLNVHHNTYKNRGNEDLKDLVVLCRDCHMKFHDKVC